MAPAHLEFFASKLNVVTTDSARVVPHALTRPLGKSTESVGSRSVRIPFRLPAESSRWRVVIRNVNYRTNTVYRGKVTLHSVTVGEAAHKTDGSLSANFASGTAYLLSYGYITEVKRSN